MLAGRKTEFRVPIGSPRCVRRGTPNGEVWKQPWRPKPGEEVPIKLGRGRATLAHAVILDFELGVVGDVDLRAAKAEGHRDVEAFRARWVSDYDRQWITRNDSPDQPLDTVDLLNRFTVRHAGTAVWACRFVLDRSAQPRYMHRASEYGYTTSLSAALEPVEVPDDGVLERFAAEGKRNHDARSAEQLTLLDEEHELAARLIVLKTLAREQGVDISGDVRVIESRINGIHRRLDSIDRKIRRAVAA